MKDRNSLEYALISFAGICGMAYSAFRNHPDTELAYMRIIDTLFSGISAVLVTVFIVFMLEAFETYFMETAFKWKSDWMPWAIIIGVAAIALSIFAIAA